MSTTSVPIRLMTAAGILLAAIGLVATITIGPAAFADSASTEASAEVQSAITLTGDVSFLLSEVPGETALATSGLTAATNNPAGYNVTVQADAADLTPADTENNTDTIPVSSVEVEDANSDFTALSDETPVTVHSQDERSAEEGDALTASYRLEMPFVNADTYSVNLTFTATAN